MDLVKLAISPEFILDHLPAMSLQEIVFGVDHELMSERAALFLATDKSGGSLDSSGKFGAAAVKNRQSMRDILGGIVETEPAQDIRTIKEKWLYLVLAWIFAHKTEYKDPLKAVEEVYADFEYPPTIASFVRYMPMTRPDLGSREDNERQLYENWEHYLRNMAAHFSG